jgi:hypothetical protein
VTLCVGLVYARPASGVAFRGLGAVGRFPYSSRDQGLKFRGEVRIR